MEQGWEAFSTGSAFAPRSRRGPARTCPVRAEAQPFSVMPAGCAGVASLGRIQGAQAFGQAVTWGLGS